MHNINKQRLLFGEFHTSVKELASYEDKFFEYFRMSQHQFHFILNLLESICERQAICLRRVFHMYILCRDTFKFNVDVGEYGWLIRKHDF